MRPSDWLPLSDLKPGSVGYHVARYQNALILYAYALGLNPLTWMPAGVTQVWDAGTSRLTAAVRRQLAARSMALGHATRWLDVPIPGSPCARLLHRMGLGPPPDSDDA